MSRVTRVLYSIAEVAEQLGVTTKTVRKLVKTGKLKAYAIGRVHRVSEADLQLYLNGCVVQPGKRVSAEEN